MRTRSCWSAVRPGVERIESVCCAREPGGVSSCKGDIGRRETYLEEGKERSAEAFEDKLDLEEKVVGSEF